MIKKLILIPTLLLTCSCAGVYVPSQDFINGVITKGVEDYIEQTSTK